jgi:hypothetical protein
VDVAKATRPTTAPAVCEPRDRDLLARRIGSEAIVSVAAFQGCILGIDPGLRGGLAFYFPSVPDKVSAFDMPTAANDVDGATLTRLISQMDPAFAVLERVASMPGQGIASTFKFGMSCGIVRGVVQALGLPLHLVAPTKWKAHFGLSADKEQARALALRLWPASAHFGRKRDHNRAEAALLARYGAEAIVGRRA